MSRQSGRTRAEGAVALHDAHVDVVFRFVVACETARALRRRSTRLRLESQLAALEAERVRSAAQAFSR